VGPRPQPNNADPDLVFHRREMLPQQVATEVDKREFRDVTGESVITELGMSLSSAYQLIPEQSTAAIIVHHPKAKYYSVGESRVEQLMK